MKKTFFDSIQKTLLSETEMETLERDLNFQPVNPESTQTLSAEQIETFNRNGCLLPLPALEDHETAAYRRLFDRLVEKMMSEGSDSFSLIDPHLNHHQVYDLMFDPRLVAYVKDLVGPDIVCWSTHLFCKLVSTFIIFKLCIISNTSKFLDFSIFTNHRDPGEFMLFTI